MLLLHDILTATKLFNNINCVYAIVVFNDQQATVIEYTINQYKCQTNMFVIIYLLYFYWNYYQLWSIIFTPFMDSSYYYY